MHMSHVTKPRSQNLVALKRYPWVPERTRFNIGVFYSNKIKARGLSSEDDNIDILSMIDYHPGHCPFAICFLVTVPCSTSLTHIGKSRKQNPKTGNVTERHLRKQNPC